MPAKRAAADAATAEEAKRYKSAIDAIADEFVCPITQELPLDPVTADDGRIYAQAARKWYLRMRAATYKNAVQEARDGAAEWLRENP